MEPLSIFSSCSTGLDKIYYVGITSFFAEAHTKFLVISQYFKGENSTYVIKKTI